jgi:hypothetical protein
MKNFYMLALSAVLGLFFTAKAQISIIDDNYGTGVSFNPFGGSNNDLSFQPGARPGSPGDRALRIIVPSAGYTGGAFVAAAPVDVSAFNALTFWVRSSKPATLNVAGLGNDASSSTTQVELGGIATTSTWTKVIIPIPNPSKLTAAVGLGHFAEGSDEGMYEIWIDDMQYETVAPGTIGAPTGVAMATQNLVTAIGGTFNAVGCVATYAISGVNKSFTMTGAYFDYTSQPAGRISFSSLGQCTAVTAGAATVTAMLNSAAVGGQINVTVNAAPAVPTTAAPTPPTRDASDVVSIFSAAYTNVTGTGWNPSWGQSTQYSEIEITGNATKKYANMNYQGVELTPALNVGAMTRLHFDIWTPDCTEFKFFLINPGGVEQPISTTPTLSGWKQVDIELSAYNTVNKTNVYQFKFESVPFGGPTVYLDNIYFYREGSLPVSLLSFTAAIKDQAVVLNWHTASETNNKGFAVERSLDGGRTWAEFQFVKANGNALGGKYQTQDAAPRKGLNHYRLRQVDVDGRMSFSAVRAVNLSSSAVNAVVYPNPARGTAKLFTGAVKGAHRYSLISADGKVLKAGWLSPDQDVHSLNIADVPAGSYVIKLSGGEVNGIIRLTVN